MLLRVVRDADERWAQDPVTQPVAPLQLADHLVVGMFRGRLVDDRLVQVRIEWQAERLDLGHALGLQQVAQLALDQAHPIDPALVGIGRDVLERAIEIVDHGQQLADQQRVGELREPLTLLVDPAPVVGEVGGSALQAAQVFIGLLARLVQHALHVLELRYQLGARRATRMARVLGGAVGGSLSHGSPSGDS